MTRILALWIGWTAVLLLAGWLGLRIGLISSVHGVLLPPAPAPSLGRELGFRVLLTLILYLPPLVVSARWMRR